MQVDARDVIADYQQQLLAASHRSAESAAIIKALGKVIAERDARIAELEAALGKTTRPE